MLNVVVGGRDSVKRYGTAYFFIRGVGKDEWLLLVMRDVTKDFPLLSTTHRYTLPQSWLERILIFFGYLQISTLN